jgi:maltose 6'-phosphate phosphatase
MTPIDLLYAKNTIARHGDTAQQELLFVLLVENLAYDKQVEVIWSGEDGTQHSLKAEYAGPAGDNRERWQARAVFPLADRSLPGDINFLFHYQAAGRDCWHPSDRQGWTINADSGVRLGERFPLVNVDFQPRLFTGHQFYPIAIGARQDLHPERVAIRWTTNHWQTSTETPAFFWHKHWHHTIGSMARNPNRYGCAMWISQLHLGDAYQVEYALLCEAQGRQYWDNNCGQNYLARHDRLKLMTLNLHCFQEERQLDKFTQIARAIRDLQVDVVCLQEVGEPWNGGYGDWNYNAAKLIRDRLGESYAVYTDWSHLGFGQYREGVAILSRYPFVAQDSRYLSPTQDAYDIHTRKAVMACIHVPYFGVINIFSVHLSWWENGFQQQFENLRRWAESKETSEVVATFLCGDFNTAAHTTGYTLLSQEYEDQFFKANAPRLSQVDDRRIDYLFMKRGNPLRVVSAGQLFTANDYGPVSDHEGYYAEFEPPV